MPTHPAPPVFRVLLCLDGEWTSDGSFRSKSFHELIISFESSFRMLIDAVRSLLGQVNEHTTLKISYKCNSSPHPVLIDDDKSLDSYLTMKSQDLDLDSMPMCIELFHNYHTHVGTCSSLPNDQTLCMTPSSFNSLSDQSNDVASVERSVSSSHQSTNYVMDSPLINCPSSYQRDNGGYTMDIVVREPNLDNDDNSTVVLSANDICTNLDFQVVTRFDPTKIELDAIYENKGDLIYHLKMLAISNLFQFHTKRSTKKLLHVVCVENRCCSWAVRAVRLPRTDMFQIRRYNHEHQCPIDARQGRTRQATYDIIADLVKYKYSDATNKPYPPKAIMKDMCRDHGISMSHKKAWSAKKKAMQLAFGSDAESYAMLPAMCYMLDRANPALRWKFFAAARAPTKSYCDRYLSPLDDEDPRIRPYLYSIGMEKWARSCFNVNRYSIMTSNNAESMNSVNATPREYPIAQLVDFIVGRMQKWFHDRRELAHSTSTILTKQCESDLLALHVASAVMTIHFHIHIHLITSFCYSRTIIFLPFFV
ncbi:hypothetical protein DM860_012210 [Cuscuta australis]|uniref:Uncharacterized protein n=1 Tax=Cuscuta australis TaxID=267555 RepID=A0A328E6E8_9ASTE|nr:hypothetical protein DM860_012210 [Cuscuta australis]